MYDRVLNSLSNKIILDLSKSKGFTSDKLTLSELTNFRLFQMTISNLVRNGKKFTKWIENTVGKMDKKLCGKGEIARYQQFLLFPLCFPMTCNADT